MKVITVFILALVLISAKCLQMAQPRHAQSSYYCPIGYIYDPVTRVCQKQTQQYCPAGYSYNAVAKACLKCPSGLFYNPQSGGC